MGRDGRQRQRSTKVVATGPGNRKKAQAVADMYEYAARGSRTARQIQKAAADLIKELTGEDTPGFSVRGWFDHWLNNQKALTSPGSWTRYRGQADRFLDHLGDKANQPIVDIERADIQAYRDARLATVSVQTTKHEIDFLRRAFKAAVHDGVLFESPVDAVKLPKITGNKQTTRRAFTIPELRDIMRHAEPEWCSLVAFGLYTGQRLGDIAKLTWANLDTEKGVVRLTTQKTGAVLEIPIADSLLSHITTLPSPSNHAAPIHPHAYDMIQRHGQVGGLSSEFRRILESTGLVEKRSHSKAPDGQGRGGRRQLSEISFHSLRHTATSLMKNAGVNNDVVMATVGHESETISREYTHAEIDAMRKAVNQIPDVREGEREGLI